MRLPGGYCYSHLHYMCVCVSAVACAHTHTRVFLWIRADSQTFWCSCSPQGAARDRRFMFSVVQTRLSWPAPGSLGLLHGHTCYSNKLHGAKSDGSVGAGGASSPQEPRGDLTTHAPTRRQLISAEAGRGRGSCSAIHHG